MTTHEPMPVHGYTQQSATAVELVNENKIMEEEILRRLDTLMHNGGTAVDGRWLAIGRTHIELAFMAINRAIFKPQRAKLPGDPA